MPGRTADLLWHAILAALMLAALAAAVARGDEPAGRVVWFRVTAYTPGPESCGQWADGITASGSRADHPLVAAPPRFPFGTLVRVPGYAGGRWVKVEDRGGAIRGNRLDVLFTGPNALARARAWGVRWIPFRIVPVPVREES